MATVELSAVELSAVELTAVELIAVELTAVELITVWSVTVELGLCNTLTGGIPSHWGTFEDDGNHGFVVSVSDVPCSDEDGCPKGAQVTVCDTKFKVESEPRVDCHGATGK
jgi:hypothetical protein